MTGTDWHWPLRGLHTFGALVAAVWARHQVREVAEELALEAKVARLTGGGPARVGRDAAARGAHREVGAHAGAAGVADVVDSAEVVVAARVVAGSIDALGDAAGLRRAGVQQLAGSRGFVAEAHVAGVGRRADGHVAVKAKPLHAGARRAAAAVGEARARRWPESEAAKETWQRSPCVAAVVVVEGAVVVVVAGTVEVVVRVAACVSVSAGVVVVEATVVVVVVAVAGVVVVVARAVEGTVVVVAGNTVEVEVARVPSCVSVAAADVVAAVCAVEVVEVAGTVVAGTTVGVHGRGGAQSRGAQSR